MLEVVATKVINEISVHIVITCIRSICVYAVVSEFNDFIKITLDVADVRLIEDDSVVIGSKHNHETVNIRRIRSEVSNDVLVYGYTSV